MMYFHLLLGSLFYVHLTSASYFDDFSLQSGAIAAETSGPRFERQPRIEKRKEDKTAFLDAEEDKPKEVKQDGRFLSMLLGGLGALAFQKSTGFGTGASSNTVFNDEDVIFRLYSKKNKKTPVIMKASDKAPDTIENYKPESDVILIIHGWMETGTGPINSAQKLKNAYLDADRPENIIIVDWGKHSTNLNYKEAAKHTVHVANSVAEFIGNLLEKKFIKDLKNIHIIGFSLGGQIAGIAGNKVQKRNDGKKVGRITGLDPNWEEFEAEVDKDKRLTADDAEFVDVIHCNMGTKTGQFGTTLVIGTADFFPNGGEHQPDCVKPGVGEPVGICSTNKCHELYLNTVNGKKYNGCICDSWKEYEADKCEQCDTLMGDPVPKTAKGKYYFRTKHE